MSAIWTDDFEGGFPGTAWVNNTGFILTSSVWNGAGASGHSIYATTTGSGIGVERAFTPSAAIYVRTYVRTSALPPDYLTILNLFTAVGGGQLRACYITLNAGNAMQFTYQSGGPLTSDTKSVTLPVIINPNTWYYVELYAKIGAGTGEYKVWVSPAGSESSTPAFTVSNINNTYSIPTPAVGTISTLGALRLAASCYSTSGIIVYHDDVAASLSPIGGSTAPAPKLNISSNPELNVPVYVDDGLGGPLVFIGNTPILGYAVVAGRTYRVQVEPEVTR